LNNLLTHFCPLVTCCCIQANAHIVKLFAAYVKVIILVHLAELALQDIKDRKNLCFSTNIAMRNGTK